MLTLVSKPDTPVLPLALGPDLTGGATAQGGEALRPFCVTRAMGRCGCCRQNRGSGPG